MLTICIPIYNFDVRTTVSRLAKQAYELPVPVEIVCIDDGSSMFYRARNASVKVDAKYIELEENVGRSKVRNMFLEYAHYDYMLFLDCDSLIDDDSFLERYIKVIQETRPGVICGGRKYPAKADRGHRLRHRYGCRCECRTAKQRSKSPYKSFMTNNFVVSKAVLQSIGFDEALSRYGHEDTLFGIHLGQKQVPIVHIDNPVLNGDVEENGLFLSKTKQGVENLVEIYLKHTVDKELDESVRVVSFYNSLKSKGLIPVVRLIYHALGNSLERLMVAGCASVKCFNFYKLGLFIDAMGQSVGRLEKKS